MNIDQFIDAVCSKSGRIHTVAMILAPENANYILADIREQHLNGHSFAYDPDPFGMMFSPPKDAPLKSDAEEITAAAQYFTVSMLPYCITAYHTQLTRDDALAIMGGVIALSRQPGACWVPAIPIFPGYEISGVYDFCDAWNKAHPDQVAIIPPDPDFG